MDIEQANGGHLPLTTDGELVYQLSHQFMIVDDRGARKAHVPSNDGLPESVWKQLTF